MSGQKSSEDMFDRFGQNSSQLSLSSNNVEEEVNTMRENVMTSTKEKEEFLSKNEILANKVIEEEKRRMNTEVMVNIVEEEIQGLKEEKKAWLQTENQYSTTESAEVKIVYPKDSFDRFGDDLSELLLSYLPIEDKFRYECVSKQWRRLIYNNVLYLDNKLFITKNLSYEDWRFIQILQLDEDHWNTENVHCRFSYLKYENEDQLKTVIKKCPNVQTIKLYVKSETVSSLTLIADNCPRLKSIYLDLCKNVSVEQLKAFCETFGTKVEALDVIHSGLKEEIIYEILCLCPNIKTLIGIDYQWMSAVADRSVPRLNILSEVNVSVVDIHRKAFILLVDIHQMTMREINITCYGINSIDLVLQQLTRLNNLEVLLLKFNSEINYFDLTPYIISLGECCPKLRMVNLFTHDIKNIDFSRPKKAVMSSIKSFEIKCLRMSDNFFVNISELMPNLKELTLDSKIVYSNQHLTDLSLMKNIRRLVLSSTEEVTHSVDDSGVSQLWDNCPKLNYLILKFRSNITPKTIERVKELAINRPKEEIIFWTKSSSDMFKAFPHSSTELPHNLSIDVCN